MDLAALLAIQVLYTIASLALISVGLAIIFGMMRVINLAHGEFLMLGGYSAIESTRAGVNIWISMLLVAPIVVGLIGVIVERTIIRWLYGRMIDTMLATWGLSLFLVGLATAIFGNTTVGLSAPLGSFQIGAYRASAYTLFVIAVAALVFLGVLLVVRYTRLGLIARGTMQNADMAAALGVNPSRGLCRHFRCRRGVDRARRRRAGAGLGRISDYRRRLRRQILHHRDWRRRRYRGGHGQRIGAVRHHQPNRDLCDNACFRRGRAACRSDCADPRASAGHHRAVLPEEHLNARPLELARPRDCRRGRRRHS